MAETPSERWGADGATLEPESGRPLHFGDPAAELDAALSACVLADRSDLARLVARGPDFLGLLNRLGTGAVAALDAGQGRPTVLTTAKGRIVERLFVHHLGAGGVLCVGGAGSESRVLEHLARYTFAERTELAGVTGGTFLLALVGPQAGAVLQALDLPAVPRFAAAPATIAGFDVQLLGQDGLSGDGRSITGRAEDGAGVWSAVARALPGGGGRVAGDLALEAWRVLRGLPASGHELTAEHNPLEAGLWDAVDFDKGCYVGQEVVARLRTYDKVSRTIVGLELPPDAPLAPPGTRLLAEGRDVGELTSAVTPPGRPVAIGLGYVKRRELRPGLELRLGAGGGPARVVELPFPVERRPA